MADDSYFSKEEMDASREDLEPARNDDDAEDYEILAKSRDEFDDIIDVRNKVNEEYFSKVKEIRERIGRMHLQLFGDPNNPDWESSIDKVRSELRHPLTREHPISWKMTNVVREIEDIQVDYEKALKLDKRIIVELGRVLDAAIMQYRKGKLQHNNDLNILKNEIKAWKERYDRDVRKQAKISSEIDLTKAESRITTSMVNDFMSQGGQRHIEMYLEGKEKRSPLASLNTYEREFIADAAAYFRSLHPAPELYGERLWKHFTRFAKGSMTLKNNIEEDVPKTTETNVPQRAALSKSAGQETLNPFSDNLGEEPFEFNPNAKTPEIKPGKQSLICPDCKRHFADTTLFDNHDCPGEPDYKPVKERGFYKEDNINDGDENI